MREGQKLWTREELFLAVNLYCKLPFGKLDRNTKEVKDLAALIGRTANSVALKLVNFSSLDPAVVSRGIKGMGNASRLDNEVWDVFCNDWSGALSDSEKLLADIKITTVERLNNVDVEDLLLEGKERQQLINIRVNQALFRTMILAGYNSTCCITGIDNSSLLVASHISPWSKDEKNRLNPRNGLCLNALHDKAFDRGLITISAVDYRICVSSSLMKNNSSAGTTYNFASYVGKTISLPHRFKPCKELLKAHNDSFIP
jgi:putative restriction endonuclease